MEAAPQSAEDRASLEATHWLVALQEEPDNREIRQRFDNWRKASALNEAAWLETQQMAGVARAMTPAYTDIWEPVVTRRRPSERDSARRFSAKAASFPWLAWRPRQRWSVVIVASLVTACLAVFVVPPVLRQIQSDYTTSTAEVRKVSLPDGSSATLAPESAIAIFYGSGERRVRLLSGEAFFDVRPEAARPFRVVANAVEASVLGTRFDVRMDSEGVTVAVEEGSVRVAPANAQGGAGDRLEAGQAVRVTWSGDGQRIRTAPELVAGWRDGQLIVQNQPLREAVDQLRRYYSGTIILTASELGDRRVTGAYNLADPEDALRGLARAHGAKVRRITPWILVISES